MLGLEQSVVRSKLDIEGRVRLKTYHEHVHAITSSSNVVTIDLSEAQNFTLTVNEKVNQFTIINIPSESSSFTIKITQEFYWWPHSWD
jgi:hypothetical protein